MQKLKKKSKKINLQSFLHKSFIPSNKNAHRPHAFRHLMLSVYSLGLIFSNVAIGTVYFPNVAVNPDQLEIQVLSQINQERSANKETLLSENNFLKIAAENKLKDMFQKNYWDHTSPNGEKAWSFINQTGYSYDSAGENLAKGFVSSESMVGAWMASPSHKKNILDKGFRETGVAVGNGFINGKEVTVAVQLFGAPSEAFAQTNALVAGEKSVSPNFSLSNPVSPQKIPFFAMYLAIFGLIILDGIMIRVNKTHKNKSHMLSFRTSLGLNIMVLAVLCLNFTYIN